MTDYPAKRTQWKKQQVKAKWREILAIFIVVFLVFAIFNGFLKAFSLKHVIAKSRWDSQSSLAIALNTKPASVAVYRKDPERLVFVTYESDSYFATGNAQNPLIKVSDVIENKDGEKLTRLVSSAFGANIDNYIIFKNEKKLNADTARKIFGDFASIATPITIFTRGVGADVASTNIGRLDMFKLWWQLKGLNVNKLDMVDFSPNDVEIIGKDDSKVRGFDSEVIHREISKYLENQKLRSENAKLEIVNASGVAGAGKLAAQIYESVGFRVVKIDTDQTDLVVSQLASFDTSSYSSRHLATICSCAIFSLPKGTEEGELKLTIGRDFVKKYYF